MQNRLVKYLVLIESVVFLAIMGLAFKLRTLDFNQGFWEDECFEYTMSAARPLWGAITFQPFPMYHIFAHFSLYLGDEEWTIRVPSLVFGLLGIALLYFVARKFTGRIMAVLAALMLSTSTYHIIASSEARFYALTIFAGLLMFYTLERALTSGRKKDWGWFIVAGNFGTLSQATLLPFLFAMAAGAALWICIDGRHETRKKLLGRIAFLTGCILLSLVGFVFCSMVGDYGVLRNLSSDSQVSNALLVEGSLISEIIHYRLGGLEYLGYFPQYFEKLGVIMGSVFVLLSLLGIRYLWKKSQALVCILLGAIIVTPIPFFILSTTHWYHPRYFCSVIPLVIMLLTGGLAFITEKILDLIATWRDAPPPAMISILIRGLVFVSFLIIIAPSIISSLLDPSLREYDRPSYRELKNTTRLIRENAAPHDMAHALSPRPDWHYYERKVLADYLVEPVKAFEPFEIFYLTNKTYVDTNELPSGATYVKKLMNEDLIGSHILRFEVTPQHLRSIPELSTFSPKDISADVRLSSKADEPITLPTTITLLEDKATCQLDSERVMAMPHRYIEWIVELNGPPQFGMLMNFYDDDGNLLLSLSRWMRETGASRIYEQSGIYGEDERVVAQREPHPTGASPPMKLTEGDFMLKLSAVTPPCATSMETQLLVSGDTRAGDVYEVHTSMVQGDWREDEHFTELLTKQSNRTFQSFEKWTMESEDELAKGTLVPTTDENPAEYHLDILIDNIGFQYSSENYPIGESNTLQLEIDFYGDIDACRPIINCYGKDDVWLGYRNLSLPFEQHFSFKRQSAIVIPGENGWSTLRGTTWVHEDTEYIQLVIAPNHMVKPTMEEDMHVRFRLPKLYGAG